MNAGAALVGVMQPNSPPIQGDRLHSVYEEDHMSEPTGRNGGYKTFAIRVPDELHAQFVLVAGLDKLSLNDAGVLAIQVLVDRKRADGDFGTRAAAALAEIEREADARRTAIQLLLGEAASATTTEKPVRRGAKDQTP
jgi:hypothetical protein